MQVPVRRLLWASLLPQVQPLPAVSVVARARFAAARRLQEALSVPQAAQWLLAAHLAPAAQRPRRLLPEQGPG